MAKKKTKTVTNKSSHKSTKKPAKKLMKPAAQKAAPKSKKPAMKMAKTAMKKTAPKAKLATKKAATKKAAPPKMMASKMSTPKMTSPKMKTTNKMSQQVTMTSAMAAHSQAPKIGEEIPDFEAKATGGQHVSLQALRGKPVVLYFYPKDATPGCTLEGRDFTKLHAEFKKLGAEVYGVSRDDMNSHEKFKTQECYTVDLLSDTEGELCNMFDVIKMKNMYGKQVKGIERSTFVIDADGKLAKEWRGVKVEGHAQQVLDFLKDSQNS